MEQPGANATHIEGQKDQCRYHQSRSRRRESPPASIVPLHDRGQAATQALQINVQFARRLITAIGIFIECLDNNAVEGRRDLRVVQARRSQRTLQNG